MAAHTFRATCRKTITRRVGDRAPFTACDETFEGAEGVVALKAHLAEFHAGTARGIEPRPSWISDKPFPHTAPRRTKGGIEAVEARIADGAYEWPRGGIFHPTAQPAAAVA